VDQDNTSTNTEKVSRMRTALDTFAALPVPSLLISEPAEVLVQRVKSIVA